MKEALEQFDDDVDEDFYFDIEALHEKTKNISKGLIYHFKGDHGYVHELTIRKIE